MKTIVSCGSTNVTPVFQTVSRIHENKFLPELLLQKLLKAFDIVNSHMINDYILGSLGELM